MVDSNAETERKPVEPKRHVQLRDEVWLGSTHHAMFLALKQQGEPLEEVSPNELSYPISKELELETFISLFKFCPQNLLLQTVYLDGRYYNHRFVNLIRDLQANTFSTTNERRLFDPSFKSDPKRPLLFPPLKVTDEIKRKIWGKARPHPKIEDIDLSGVISVDPTKKKSPKKSVQTPITTEDRQKMFSDAYKDLVVRFGREFFSKYKIWPYWSEEYDIRFIENILFISNDYLNPVLLLMEELEERGYGIKLFRVVRESKKRKVVDLQDYLEDGFTVLVADEARTFMNLVMKGGLRILNDLYRSNSDLYLNALRGRPYSEDYRKRIESEFSKEERSRILAFALQRRIDLRVDHGESVEEYKEELRKLNVEPADQILLRKIVARLVDQVLAKDQKKREGM